MDVAKATDLGDAGYIVLTMTTFAQYRRWCDSDWVGRLRCLCGKSADGSPELIYMPLGVIHVHQKKIIYYVNRTDRRGFYGERPTLDIEI